MTRSKSVGILLVDSVVLAAFSAPAYAATGTEQ